MHGEIPLSVTAVSQTGKPDIYPHVDDDARVIVHYPRMQAVLMPSWNCTFCRKGMELYGTQATAVMVRPDRLRLRLRREPEEKLASAAPLPSDESTSLAYLAAVLHGSVKDEGGLSSLDTNLVLCKSSTRPAHPQRQAAPS